MITIDNHKNDFELKALSAAAEHYLKMLIHDEDIRNEMDIYIEICDGINYDDENPDHPIVGYAACESEDDEKPRHFYMALLRDDPANMLVTLAHEMVHIKQHALEEMKKFMHNGVMYCRFLGYDYPVDSLYDDMPWEQEAYALELPLVSSWGNSKCIM